MPDVNRTDRVYARCFKRVKEGHAVFAGESALVLKPGVCGYFDEDGDWKKIVYINKPSELEKGSFTGLEGIKVSSSSVKETWGPKISSTMKKVSVSGGGEGGFVTISFICTA
jgi:hypothetical protein